jgi:hypothetical protein
MVRLSAVLDPEQLPDDPDDEPEEEPATAGGAFTGAPRVYDGDEREWEFRTENLTLAEVVDGKTLAERLAAAARDNWHLAFAIDAGDTRVLVLRRPKKAERERRAVGFAPPAVAAKK